MNKFAMGIFLVVLTGSGMAQTLPAFASASATDPATLGWMLGAPPAPEKTIRFSDTSHYRFPQLRWTFANFRRVSPTANIWRGDAPVVPLPRALRSDIESISFVPTGSTEPISFAESFDKTYADAILVMHRGRIVYERYFGLMKPQTPHFVASVTKSFVGTIAASLVEEGKLDPTALVTKYIPELANGAYADATVRQVMDMTIGVHFNENYADPTANGWQHGRAVGFLPRPPGDTGPKSNFESLQALRKEGNHGQAFAYKTVNSDVLGWLISRVTGQSVSELLSERLWQKFGAEFDAYMIVDAVGTEFSGGGLNLALRDAARFGEMMRLDGVINKQQVVPKAVVDDIRRGGKKSDFASANLPGLTGWSYRNQWWITHNEHGAYWARGIHGQAIYIDPKAEMVIVRFGSHPLAAGTATNPNTLPAFHAVAKHLMR